VRRAQLRILFHGLVILLVGLLCGFPYGRAIRLQWGEEAVRAWRLAHFGLVVAGLWLMVVAGVSHLLVLTTRTIALLLYSLLTSAYGVTIATLIEAVGGVRGLEPASPGLNVVAFLFNVIGAVAALVWIAVMILGTVVALRQADS
jgi:hypothetical protein